MKIYISLLLILCNLNFKAQDIRIIDADTKKNIDSVRLYNKNVFLGFLNQEMLKKHHDNDTLTLVKEGYEDSLVPIINLKNESIIYLTKNKVIEIPEVVINYINPDKLISNIIVTAKISNRSAEKNYYHFFYEFKNDNNTIQYFNGRVIEQGFKYKVEKSLDYSSNMIHTSVVNEKGKEVYLLQKTNYSHFLDHQMYPVLWKIFLKDNKIMNYNFKIVGKEKNFLKLFFYPKINIGWDYNGYIICDINDFGIYEFSANLIKNPNNEIENLLETKMSIYIKNSRRGDKYYVLENANFIDEFIISRGKNKNVTFKAHSFQEKTFNFNNGELEDFDFILFKKK